MSTLNAKSISRLRVTLQRTNGVEGTYYQDGQEIATFLAIPDRPVLQRRGTEEYVIASDEHDWLMNPDDLAGATPGRGDIWATAAMTYELVDRDYPRPWQWNDESETLLRVFTHEVDADPRDE